MKYISLGLRVILYFTAILIGVLLLFSLLGKLIRFPDHSFIYLFGYLPVFWLVLVLLIVSIVFLVIRHKKSGLTFLGLAVAFMVFLGDLSLNWVKLHKTPDLFSFTKLNVIAYNVRYYSYGMENIASFIRNSHADVLLLSESELDTVQRKRFMGLLPGYTLISDQRNDLSILSRYPITGYNIVELPTPVASLSGNNDLDKLNSVSQNRAFVHAIIDMDGTPVHAISLRLIAGRAKDKSIRESLRWGQYLVNAQQQELEVFLNYINALDGPLVFGGDLNAPPNSRVIETLYSKAKDAFLKDHLFGSLTFRTVFPTFRLDYIFHSKEIITLSTEMMPVYLSDHYPVKAELLIPKRQSFVQQ